MAYTTYHQITVTLNKALDYIENPEKTTVTTAMGYITNPEKTEDMMLVSGYNVDPLTASIDFTITQAMAKQIVGTRGTKAGTPTLAYHLIQSFEPGEVTPQQAHELGKRLANELLEGKFEYVIATHVDQKHIHNHVVFNATSFYDYKKFRSQPGKTASKIRAISDRICAEADLSVIKQAQFDKTYRYRKQRGTSWRRLIRRRLLFVLEAAGSFDEFVEGAARLGVTVGISKDDLSYMLEGQGQKNLVYGKSMDKNGTFTREGIEAQIVANTDIREQLKQNIREAAATATDCKEFRAELQRRGIKATQTRKMGMRYAIGKEDVVWEWALGPAYSTEAIQAAFYSPQSAFEEHGSPLDGIEGEFAKTNQSDAQEVPVTIRRDQVLKTTADGILIAVPDEKAGVDQLVFIDHNHVIYHKAVDSFDAYVGNGYDYYVAAAPDGQPTNARIKGENIIRAMELANGVKPEYLDIAPQDVRAISPKGLTLSMPDLGIESVFIEDRYVEYGLTQGGSARVALYKHWSYNFHRPDGSVNTLTGEVLADHLRPRQEAGGGSLLSRINAMQRRRKEADLDKWVSIISTIGREKINDMADFAPRLADLQEKQASIQASISALQARNAEYTKVARYLAAYNTYLPVKLEAMQLPGWQRRKFEYHHKAELDAWASADSELRKCGVEPKVPEEKVRELVKEQERQMNELKAQADKLADRAMELETARGEIQRLNGSVPQPDQPRRHPSHGQEL